MACAVGHVDAHRGSVMQWGPAVHSWQALICPSVSIGGVYALSKYRSSILNSPLRGTARTIQRAMEGAGEAMTRDVVWSRRLRPGRGVARSLSCKDSQNAGLPQR